MRRSPKLPAKILRDNGWVKHPEGIGWVKNGAFYGHQIGVVGQFGDDPDGRRVAMDLDSGLPAPVVLHFINAFADAGNLSLARD